MLCALCALQPYHAFLMPYVGCTSDAHILFTDLSCRYACWHIGEVWLAACSDRTRVGTGAVSVSRDRKGGLLVLLMRSRRHV
jgi:hypothetical protein